MSLNLQQEPRLKNPILFCGWPGIGNIGLIAIDTLRSMLEAQEFGEIEPWDFFDPRKVVIENGLLEDLEFPSNKFYYRRLPEQDAIFFIGQEQPAEGSSRYGAGEKAYRMANLVLDVAERFDCQRVYTSGAAVTQIHHSHRPRVWAVPNRPDLIAEINGYHNTVLMSQIEGRNGQGMITGLNGLLLGVAKERRCEAICLMGEIPYYLQGAPWPYPKASQSVLEVLSQILKVPLELKPLEDMAEKVQENIEEFLERLYSIEGVPPEIRQEIEKLEYRKGADLGPITEEEQKKIMEHIDELFNQRGGKNDRHL